ncbi:AAA family ATPase [Synechococcus sp. PCC 7336]|uniref:AAA family ATPase n=1 Tax=Synechococcus sp. PCC 7336 TaxID=195250 RepID=UPI000345653D|nr:AAA family ATPase [Synechococcus sp. PCC 7336]
MSFYIAPRFLDRISVHITKNFLDIPGIQVPLILGIHGPKGEGKSFQCELVFRKMGIEPIRMSSGELESPDAGDPVRLIRLRYREASERVKVRGRMCVLMINDLDAGAGRMNQTTQYTVNTQLVNGTLMNIADNPTDVQLPGSYNEEKIRRVPVIVTGNDFSTLYDPLLRDGRMEKFYWQPTLAERVGVATGIFEADGLSSGDVKKLVETFADCSIDFFSALRSRLYDEQVLSLIQQVGIEKISSRVVNSTEALPSFAQIDFHLARLLEVGNQMLQEREFVETNQLAAKYNRTPQQMH